MKKYTVAEVRPIAMKDVNALLVHWGGYDWEQTADERQDEYQKAIDEAPQEDIDRAVLALVDALNADGISYSQDRERNIETARGSL